MFYANPYRWRWRHPSLAAENYFDYGTGIQRKQYHCLRGWGWGRVFPVRGGLILESIDTRLLGKKTSTKLVDPRLPHALRQRAWHCVKRKVALFCKRLGVSQGTASDSCRGPPTEERMPQRRHGRLFRDKADLRWANGVNFSESVWSNNLLN